MLQNEEDIIIEFLALVYNRVPWNKMKTSKNPHDIFNHRVRAAARRSNIYEFSSKLSNYFGLQTLPPEAIKLLDKLRMNETKILNTISLEHIPICVHAIIRAKEMRPKKIIKTKIQKEKKKCLL